MTTKRIVTLAEKRKKLLAALDETRAAEREAARKAESRRRYLVGGFVLEAVEKDAELRAKVSEIVLRGISDRDRDLMRDFLRTNRRAPKEKPSTVREDTATNASQTKPVTTEPNATKGNPVQPESTSNAI